LNALSPTIATLHDAVNTLTVVVDPLSNIAERIPFRPRRPRHLPPWVVAPDRTRPVDPDYLARHDDDE
jgi:hypothetical protein